MLNKLEVNAKIIVLEPGDMTRYQFIVSPSLDGSDYLIIANAGDSPDFISYDYKKSSIINFFDEVGRPPKNKKNYENWIDLVIKEKNPYLLYVMTHSGDCNPYTAIAGLISALLFMDDSIIVGIEDN